MKYVKLGVYWLLYGLREGLILLTAGADALSDLCLAGMRWAKA